MQTDNLPLVIRKILAYRRKARVDFLIGKIAVTSSMKIIDIGCGVDGRSFDDYAPEDWQITGIDVLGANLVHHKHPRFSYVQQDARDLGRWKDREFDLAISIGMLEHITNEADFNAVVSELRRVATQYIVVVPYKYCWIEPHYGIPFFPLFPYSAKIAIVKALNLSNHRDRVKNNPHYINENYLWRSNSEYRKAFPDSTINLMPTLEMIAITKSCQ